VVDDGGRGALAGELNDRYLTMEASGMKARCTQLAARVAWEPTETH
jgi:hypothetical protein